VAYRCPIAAIEPSERLRDELSRPESYPDRPTRVEVRETHISWVFLAGDRAYKLKKPVVLAFLDYGTPAARREMCREEVRLNRRLAPDIYIGVRGVALTADGVELTSEDDPRAVDFVVEMRRYDESRTVALMMEQGSLGEAQIIRVAEVLAQFHAEAPKVEVFGAPALAIERRFQDNVHQLSMLVEAPEEIERVQALELFARAFASAHAPTFRLRAREGCVREGHGDLRADHTIVNGGVQIVDCAEFDRSYRELDIADDLAFLVYDLTARGGERYADLLVQAYRDAGGDPGSDSLLAFYAAHRAVVRAKVGLVRAGQLEPGAAREREGAHARSLIAVAERFAWRGRLPLAVVVCGVPASGKSHLARTLADRSGLSHVSSDLIRKRLRGVRSTEPAPSDSYTAAWNARTYAELGRVAAAEITASGGVIVDGTFRHRDDRGAFASAFGASAPAVFVECQAPPALIADRAAQREHDDDRVSDADVAVALRELRRWDPLDEVPGHAHVVMRTDRPVAEIVGDVTVLLDRHLSSIHG
jgi:aminoglycoside phosphotransferase family enzyme/predicted kinase